MGLSRLWKCVEKAKDPGSERRTWGTLRVVLICEGVKVSTFGGLEFGTSKLNRSGPPADVPSLPRFFLKRQ